MRAKKLSITTKKICLLIISVLSLTACNNRVTNQPNHTSQRSANNTPNSSLASSEVVTQNQSNTPTIIQLPVHIQALNLLVHPMVPVFKNKKGYAQKILSSSAKKGKGMQTGYFNEQENLHFNVHANNLIFESYQPNNTFEDDINNVQNSEVTTKNETIALQYRSHTLFKHSKFLITDMFYPHVITTESIVCNSHDKFQKYCKTVVNFQKNDTNISNQVNTKHDNALTTKVKQKQFFNRFIFNVQEINLTDEQREKVEGNLHVQESLYMSDGMGRNVKKLHPNNQYVTHSKWLPELSRYYFTTRSDSNGNNTIDFMDNAFNYVIQFSTNEAKNAVVNPVKYAPD